MQIIRDIRIESHQLGNKVFDKPKDIVAWMGAIQAQDYNMSKLAIFNRLKGNSMLDIELAFKNGEILRTHVMRPTWHLVNSEDIRWMLQLSKTRLKSVGKERDRYLDITEELYTKTNNLIFRILEGNKHLTRTEISLELSKAGIVVNNSRMIHFMMRAETEGIVCSGIDNGKKQTYTLLDERVHKTKEFNKEEALTKLAINYFRSHSPASLIDFCWWSGLSVKEAREATGSIETELISEKFLSKKLLIHKSYNEKILQKDSMLFLPAFDEYLIAYKDRTTVIDLDHQSKVFSKNGIFHPIIVKNGKIIGVWRNSGKTVEKLFF
ncbi:MAG: winged helix DNA-binding domain-containing protein [Bacteroidales bacterium]|jgi:hypothetical protein|nr:winged helix DNA-binding domain-containing protein [Bacteroidales bacterium]